MNRTTNKETTVNRNPYPTRRRTYGEIQVGDGITTREAGDGRGYAGTVTAVTHREVAHRGLCACITVAVHTRDLCADDLVRGFQGATYGLTYPVGEYTMTKRAPWRGASIKRWCGLLVTPPADPAAAADAANDLPF